MKHHDERARGHQRFRRSDRIQIRGGDMSRVTRIALIALLVLFLVLVLVWVLDVFLTGTFVERPSGWGG
jgi:hypothetical protein